MPYQIKASRITAHADLDEGDQVRRADALLRDLSPLLNAVGLMAVAHSQAAFENQAFDGVPWRPRMNPNIPGVITDVNAGRFPRPQRFTDRPALIDSGTLRGRIAHWIVGPDTVEVGSKEPYASTHHLGLESVAPGITKEGQKKLWEWMKRQGLGRAGKIRAQLAGAKARADKRFSKGYANVWGRAKGHAVQKILNASTTFAGNLSAWKNAKASGATSLANTLLKSLNRERAAARARVEAGGINNPLLRAAYRELLSRLQAKRGATTASAQSAADERTKRLKAFQASRPLFAKAASLGYLLSPTMVGVTKTIKHPARPFVGVPPELRQEVERQLGLRIGLA